MRALVLVVLLMWCGGEVLAQQQSAPPPSAQPGAAERQLRPPPEPNLPSQQSVPVLSVPDRAPPGADTITFTLKGVTVEGARAVPQTELAATYSAFVGKSVSLAQVYGIAGKMTALYREQGYLLSSVVVPAQSISQGNVRLQVVEGFLGQVSFEGYTGLRHGLFESVRARLLADRPLRTATLERVMLLLNDLPGIRAQAVLQPSAATTGAADLVIRIHRSAVSLAAGFSNRGATVEGPNQLQGNLTFDSLFGDLGGTNFQYLQASDVAKLRLYAGSEVARLTADGLDLLISGSHSLSHPALGTNFAGYNFATDTALGRIELDYPFLRARASSVTARVALTYTDAKTDSLGASVTRDQFPAARLGVRWDHLDSWHGVNLVDAEYSQGFNALGASPFGVQSASRPGGHPDFSKATLYIARLQSLGGPFSLLLASSGQYAFSRLLESEEFAFGGEPFGRAYDPSEFVGDSGLAGKLELRYTLETPIGMAATFYGFADRGEAWRRLLSTETGVARTEAASSAGGGVRASIRSWLTGYIEGAKPLDHTVAARGNEDARVFAGVQALLTY